LFPQQQSAGAAWPHVLGILAGHIYHFFTEIWPALGGTARLLPPDWLLAKLGGPPSSNIKGVSWKKREKETARQAKKGGLFSKPKGRARKLTE